MVARDEQAQSPSRQQPAYGEGRLTYEPPTQVEESIDRRAEVVLALAIFIPAAAAYAAIGYGLYLAAMALL